MQRALDQSFAINCGGDNLLDGVDSLEDDQSEYATANIVDTKLHKKVKKSPGKRKKPPRDPNGSSKKI